jgi:hypothetical protein
MKAAAPLIVLLLLAIAGCSQPDFYWYRVDATLEETEADYCACREQARQAAAEVVADEYFDRLRSPLYASDTYAAAGDQGMSPSEALNARTSWGALYEKNALAGCMKGSGYVPLEAHRVPSHLQTKDLPLGAIAGRKSDD